MSTRLWFIPTYPALTSFTNGECVRYVLGRVSGKARQADGTFRVIAGEYVIATKLPSDFRVQNLIFSNADTLDLLAEAVSRQNVWLCLEVAEDLTSSPYNELYPQRLTLKSYQCDSAEAASLDQQFVSIIDLPKVKDAYARRGDYAELIDEINLSIIGNREAHLNCFEHNVLALLENLTAFSTCHLTDPRTGDLAFRAYVSAYVSLSRIDFEEVLQSIESYILKFLPYEDGGTRSIGIKLASAIAMECREFDATFLTVEDTNHPDWIAYSFLKFWRSCIWRLHNYDADAITRPLKALQVILIENALRSYIKLGFKVPAFERCVASILFSGVKHNIEVSIRRHYRDFYLLQSGAAMLSAIFGYSFGSTAFFITFLIVNVIGQSINAAFSNAMRMEFDGDEVKDFNMLITQLEQAKRHRLFVKPPLSRLLPFVEQSIATIK